MTDAGTDTAPPTADTPAASVQPSTPPKQRWLVGRSKTAETRPQPLTPLVRPGVDPMPPSALARLQGEAIGRGFWPALLGVGSITLHIRGLDDLGLYAIVFRLPAGVVMAFALSTIFRQAKPLLGWRRWCVAAVTCVPSIVAIRLGTPIERWARVPQSSWEEWSFTVAAPFSAFWFISIFNAKAAEVRFRSGSGSAGTHRGWHDERIRFLRRRVALIRWAPWTRQEVQRQARGSLGFALMARFRHPEGGSLVDVVAAIDEFSQVVRMTLQDSPDAATVRFELHRAVAAFHDAQVADSDLDEPIETLRDIVEGWSDRMPSVDQDFARSLLGMLLARRYLSAIRDGDPLPGGAEAEVRRELDRLEARARQHVDSDWLAVQMLAPVGQFHVTLPLVDPADPPLPDAQRLAELDHGIRVLTEALPRAVADNQAALGAVRAYLALGLATRYRLRRDRDPDTAPADLVGDLTDATEHVLLALADPALHAAQPADNTPTVLAIAVRAARDCMDAELARGRWKTALRICGPALAAVGEIIAKSVYDVDIYQAAGYWQGLHDAAAYAIARSGEGDGRAPAEVAALIEWGRGIRLSAGLAESYPEQSVPDGLSAQDRAAWVALVRRGKQIEAIQYARGRRATAQQEGRLRDEQVRINRAIQEINSRTTRAAQAPVTAVQTYLPMMAEAAAEAPLCYLVQLPPTRVGERSPLPGLAVLVQHRPAPDPLQITLLNLPAATGTAVAAWIRQWTSTTEADRQRDLDPPGQNAGQPPESVDSLLLELGTSIMQPVLEAAGHPDRLVLLPDGILGLLPLHAALVPQPGGGPDRYACLDTVISYAPSVAVRNLCRAATRLADGNDGPGGAPVFPTDFLGVAVPTTQLRGAEPEVATCSTFFEHTTLLADPRTPPSPDRVMRALDTRPIGPRVVHLACHGFIHPRDALSSALKLVPPPGEPEPLTPQQAEYAEAINPATAADMLTISDIWRANLAGTRLAVLSACHSGAAAASQPGEFTSLATGFIRSGVPGVVSTLARVDDLAARIVACRFYREWQDSPADPAAALAAAQRWLATAPPGEIADWVHWRADCPECTTEKAARLNHPAAWAAFSFTGA